MKISFSSPSISGDFKLPDDCAPFLIWLVTNRENPRAHSILALVAEHDREASDGERENIRCTIVEILGNTLQ